MAAGKAGRTSDQHRTVRNRRCCHGLLLARAVLRLHVRLVRRVLFLDGAPPPLVVAIPLDGLPQSLLERHLWGPAGRAQLARVEAVAPVVPGPVGHWLDERAWLAQAVENAVRQLDVHDVVAAADVVDLAV